MAPLMLRNKMSGLMSMCVSVPVPDSVILGSQRGTTQMNSTIEVFKKTALCFGYEKDFILLLWDQREKHKRLFSTENMYPHGKLAFGLFFFLSVFFLC